MFDHVKFGVSDYSASKAFFVKALQPLGVTVITDWPPSGVGLSQSEVEFHFACIKPMKCPLNSTWHSLPRVGHKSKHSIAQL
jgi:catechol 2,3-dioxygenase-like lactoylglutathione lyase family enzyme